MPNPFPSPDPAPAAEMLELFMTAASGIFSGPVLEALIARLEVGK